MKIPKPRKLPSGSWFIQLRIGGESVPITEDSEDLCVAKAMAIKTGLIEMKKKPADKTLGNLVDEYINDRTNILSPSTIRSYKNIRKFRFTALMDISINKLSKSLVQSSINAEAKLVSPKTLKNSWGLVVSALSEHSTFDLKKITLPSLQPRSVTVYDATQLGKLFKAIEGDDIELAILLAACLGLRRSEILGLTYSAFNKDVGIVSITMARVPDEKNTLVEKGTKTAKSTRILPCPQFILDKVGSGSGFIYDGHKQNYIRERLRRICQKSGLPDISLHELRHTNASIMLSLNVPDKYAMERGGWSSNQTMKNIYQHTISDQRKATDNAVNGYFENIFEGLKNETV